MKILIFRTCSVPINIGTYNVQEIGLAKSIVQKGNVCDIIFYTSDKKEKIEYIENGKIKIYWLPAINLLHNGVFNKKRIKAICNEYDIIQLSDYDQYMTFCLLKWNIKPIVIYHGPYSNNFYWKYNLLNYLFDKIFLKQFIKRQPKIISKSNLAEDTLKCKGFTNITTVGVGIDLKRFENEEKIGNELIEKINNKKIILYVGQICKRRNTEFLINVFEKVSIKDENVRLVIIGNGKKKYVSKILKMIKDKKIDDKIIYINKMKQSELSNLYKRANVFLLPTYYEIYGMVLLEAMYFSLPVLTTYNGGSSTLIENNINGYICEMNENKWVDLLKKMINDDDETVNTKANEKVINGYTWEVLAPKFLEIYKEVIEGQKNG